MLSLLLAILFCEAFAAPTLPTSFTTTIKFARNWGTDREETREFFYDGSKLLATVLGGVPHFQFTSCVAPQEDLVWGSDLSWCNRTCSGADCVQGVCDTTALIWWKALETATQTGTCDNGKGDLWDTDPTSFLQRISYCLKRDSNPSPLWTKIEYQQNYTTIMNTDVFLSLPAPAIDMLLVPPPSCPSLAPSAIIPSKAQKRETQECSKVKYACEGGFAPACCPGLRCRILLDYGTCYPAF